MLKRDVVFTTPFGDTPPISHFELPLDAGGVRPVLFSRPYAGLAGATAAIPSHQRAQQVLALFWVLQRAGVTRVVAESGAASITQHFHPRDLVVPHDFIDFTHQHGGQLEPGVILVMRDPFCPEIREALWQRARQFAADKATRVFNRAIHVTVEGPRMETAAEVAALARMGGDIISQGLTPEIYLAREIGACFGSVEMVLNYAEGVRPEWDFELLRAIVREGAEELGRVALDALLALPEEPQCSCSTHRPTVPEVAEVVAESA
jgi:5'-methylthioadenosine phosphorylase